MRARRVRVVQWMVAGAAFLSCLFWIYWRTQDVVACVARYSKPKLAPADIRRFIEHGQDDCFARRNPAKLDKQARHLPLSLGVDVRNGKTVEVVSLCGEVCDHLSIDVQYATSSRADCCASGGRPLRDFAWGGYLGCAPPEYPPQEKPRFYYPRHPGGRMEPATREPCDPSKIVFDDGTIIMDPSPRTP